MIGDAVSTSFGGSITGKPTTEGVGEKKAGEGEAGAEAEAEAEGKPTVFDCGYGQGKPTVFECGYGQG